MVDTLMKLSSRKKHYTLDSNTEKNTVSCSYYWYALYSAPETGRHTRQWTSTPYRPNVSFLSYYRLIGLIMTLTFDLGNLFRLSQWPLTWWIFIASFIEIPPLTTEISCYLFIVIFIYCYLFIYVIYFSYC